MKNITRKLLVSILAVAFAVIALGTSTYAWFTLGGTVSTGQFSSEMVASKGMEISIDNQTWYSTMAADVVNDALAAAPYTDLAFTDVTTADGKAFTNVAGGAAIANTDYLALPIYIKTTKASATVYLSAADFSATATINWTADAGATDGTHTIKAGTAYDFNAANAVRLSIINEADAVAGVYDPADDTNTHGEAVQAGFAANYATAKGFTIGSTIVPVTPNVTPLTKDVSSKAISFTTSGTAADGWYHTTITLNIWLDGWDGDCINAIMGSTLVSTIGFSLTNPTA